MQVDIISMSWTIPAKKVHERLENAVKEALAERIVMFGAASDQGLLADKYPYMGRLKGEEGNGPVICIGGAGEAGYGKKKARSEVNTRG